MAKFLVGAMPAVGHVTPLISLVRALVERGHEVRWYTGKRFQSQIEAVGAQYLPMKSAPDVDENELDVFFPQRRALSGLKQLKFDIKHFFADSATGQVKDWQEILVDYPADLLFADSTFIGAGWTHELGGPPWAVYNPLPVTLSSRDTAPFGLGLPPATSALGRVRVKALQALFTRVLFRDTIKYADKLRQDLGLRPTGQFIMDRTLSPFLYMQGTVPGFEYPRSDLPPQVHFIGPVLSSAVSDFEPPAWWDDLHSGRPVVHVTQGTVATDASHLLIPTIRALADEDVLVVATTGGKPVESLGLESLPDNARVEAFIPHAHLLPHVDVMITNGGYNGVQMALSHGVPLIAAGTTEDKPEVCARVAWAGVGVNLKTSSPSESTLREAVRTILDNPSYRQRAGALAEEFARHHAPTEAAELLEQLVETGQPVIVRRQQAGQYAPR